ncbi:hypothetical protein GCM10009128_11900 [Psychrosphaera haliotis]
MKNFGFTKTASLLVLFTTTDYVPIAKRVNYMALSSAPLGQYHKLHNTDQTQTSVNRFKAK